jgi:hypothetical protein
MFKSPKFFKLSSVRSNETLQILQNFKFFSLLLGLISGLYHLFPVSR